MLGIPGYRGQARTPPRCAGLPLCRSLKCWIPPSEEAPHPALSPLRQGEGKQRGHRVEKEIRLKLDIRDATGTTPNYLVLVSLTVDGRHAGTLIKDPAGARTECQNLVFLWHDRDAQENLIPSEEVGFRLGTYSRLEGFENDVTSPGGHKPIWGMAETINLQIWTTDSSGLVEVFSRTLSVKEEPGKPDHFAVRCR